MIIPHNIEKRRRAVRLRHGKDWVKLLKEMDVLARRIRRHIWLINYIDLNPEGGLDTPHNRLLRIEGQLGNIQGDATAVLNTLARAKQRLRLS